MSGYKTIQRIRELEQQIDELGFKFSSSKHGFYEKDFGDVVTLTPKDQDSLPIYARDAEMFVGTLEDVHVWLLGVHWARNYDMMLKLSNQKKRERKEQDVRNRRLLKQLASPTLEDKD